MHFALIPGDAVSNQMLEIQARLRAWGYDSHIYAQILAPEMRERARPASEYLDLLQAPGDLLLYHYGLYHPNVRYYQAMQGRRVLIYHNITPAHYYRGWDRSQELLCDLGRRVLPLLTRCDLALGDSDYNRRELVRAGCAEDRTGVLPIFLPQAHFDALPVARDLRADLDAAGTINLLTVGRVAPNKAIEDAIRIFAVYHRAINPRSRLYVVGSRYLPAYDAALDELVADLGLEDSVVFTGRVPDAELKTYFLGAHVYLATSLHEGFCVPIVEAMHFGLPILARRAAAMPETLADAGVLFTRLGYEEVAEMVHLLVTDVSLRTRIIDRQRARLQEYAPSRVEATLRTHLRNLDVPLPEGGTPPNPVGAGSPRPRPHLAEE